MCFYFSFLSLSISRVALYLFISLSEVFALRVLCAFSPTPTKEEEINAAARFGTPQRRTQKNQKRNETVRASVGVWYTPLRRAAVRPSRRTFSATFHRLFLTFAQLNSPHTFFYFVVSFSIFVSAGEERTHLSLSLSRARSENTLKRERGESVVVSREKKRKDRLLLLLLLLRFARTR
jgi:hypothetical protein